VGPNRPVTQTYTVFAGPKTSETLRPYGAEALATYRKSGWFGIPFAPEVAGVISPLLDIIYRFTQSVARLFGGTKGNYGLSIILLTLLVRMLMFPLGRKQAISAKKMQDLQPHLKAIQEKYKDDKEQQTRETFALYKKHGVNPVGGCIPALIQLPIFVGLWQALNTSVHLRHASFLWIQNLAAPDMLFRFPVEVPFLGKYFNILPFLVVALMLVQTKLFSPPATTPEAEMQQKMMKYMMVFMAFMFYKVPSGLGLYFITSSLWQIGERLLLPKAVGKPAVVGGDDGQPPRGPGGKGGPGGNGAPPKPPGKFAQFFEKLLEEAKKDPTYRKVMGELEDDRNKGKEPGRDRDRDRDRGKSKARPGRRR
jgi:YidC/Oxa1 family membrane protein insertase